MKGAMGYGFASMTAGANGLAQTVYGFSPRRASLPGAVSHR